MKYFGIASILFSSLLCCSVAHAQSTSEEVSALMQKERVAGGIGFKRVDPMYHQQDFPRSWADYDIIPTITGSGGYGDAAGSSPGDPVVLFTDDNTPPLPPDFVGRPDLPVTDDQLATLNEQRASDDSNNQSKDAYDIYTR